MTHHFFYLGKQKEIPKKNKIKSVKLHNLAANQNAVNCKKHTEASKSLYVLYTIVLRAEIVVIFESEMFTQFPPVLY